MTISKKLNPTNRYDRVSGPKVPWGYEVSDYDPYLLIPVEEQLEALDEAYKYLKHSSYKEVARWLSEYTGRKITAMGLWKRAKIDKADRQTQVKQNRYEAKTEAKGNITTQANV